MRSLGERLHLLRKLLNLRMGPGAAILPSEVSHIHMDFALRTHNGHMGAKKFWRENLPRLKYHNPAVPMIVNRHGQNEQPPTMTVYLRTAAAAAGDAPAVAPPASSRVGLSKAQPPASNERVVHIDMKDKHSTNILEQLIAQVGAVPLRPTAEDTAEWQSLEELRKVSNASRDRINAIKAEKEREANMLRQARAAGGATEDPA
ncbi:50S ribosomal protein Mrp49 [Cordyceps fumosorosea ARSEF 2679]|uniref:50S ribosomal protein Mrp49 n=1 Tax=Cordyceps fumosorosea (strain ARSEF 2679) TaxID=1081104 RepID=A0A168BRV4_CORFA|nr:50S ribosomal protein Mrp49 [Cordyceps fumosorosea ARSEF 2679]OAA70467.1 50S ribosomal protein Mrp49 [Cordyceps fumosorosea ARSEF 2679]